MKNDLKKTKAQLIAELNDLRTHGREREKRLNEAERIAHLGNFSWEIATGSVTWSDGLHRMLGYDKTEKIDYNKVNSEIHHPEDLERITTWLNECIASGNTNFQPNEYRLICKDGSVINVRTTIEVIHKNDLPYKIFGTVQDISAEKDAEKVFLESEHRYRQMLETTLDGFILADKEGQIIEVNPSYCQMIGYSEKELLSMNIRNIEAKLSEEEVTLRIQHMLKEGRAHFKTRHQTKKGQLIDLDVSISTIQEDKKPPLVAAFVRDITNQKQVREALNDSERKFQKIIDESFEGISVADEEGKIIIWNNALEKITGIEKSQTINRYIWDVEAELIDHDLNGRERKEAVKTTLLDPLKTGKAPWLNITMERDYIHPDGTLKTVSGCMYTIKTQKGYLIVSISQDVTQRKLADDALRESEEKFKKAFSTNPDSININRLEDGMYISINEGFTKITGYSEDDVIGKTSMEINIWANDSDRKTLLEGLRNHGQVQNLEAQFRMKDGKIVYGLMSAAVITLDGVPHIISITRDITERKQTEQVLKTSEQRLRQAQKAGKIGIWSVNVNTGEQYLSEVAASFYGLREGTYSTDDTFGMVPEEDLPALNHAFKQTVEKASEFNIEHRIINKNTAKVIWVYSRGQAVTDSDGKIILIHGTAQDITERKNAEAKIKESEELFSKAFRSSPIAITITDQKTGKFIHVNRAWSQIYEYTEEEAIGKTAVELQIVDEKTRLQIIDELKIKGNLQNVEIHLRNKSGSYNWVLYSTESIVLGGVPCVLSTGIDITERKKTKKAYKEAKSNLEALLDNRKDSIWSLDCNYNYLVFNKPYADIIYKEMGIRLEKGLNALEIHPKEVNEIWKPKFDKVLDGDSVTFEFPHVLDGKEHFFEVFMNPIYSDGKITGLSALSMDITDRKEAEKKIIIAHQQLKEEQKKLVAANEQLKKSINSAKEKEKLASRAKKQAIENQEKFETAFVEHPDAIAITSIADGKILEINPSFYTITGYTPEEAEGKKTTDLELWADPKDRIEMLNRIKKEGYVSNFEFFRKMKDGSLKETALFATTITINNESCLLSIIRDISAQKASEKKLDDYRKHLEDLVKKRTASLENSNKELESFSYSVSHDLRAPLRSIHGFTQILREEYASQLDEEGKRVCRIIEDNALKMGQLIDDLLTFSRYSRSEISKVNIDMKNMVHSMFNEVTDKDSRKRIAFKVGELHDAPADPTTIKQIWINLLSNAIKYSSKKDKSKISVTSKSKKDHIEYCICDNGAGFDMKYADNLFGVFQRLHSADEFEGNGIGLAHVKRLVSKHGGEVWAESKVDKGAKFYFSLPKEQHDSLLDKKE